jgi:predicted tellurium resistance membrane protein TerC
MEFFSFDWISDPQVWISLVTLIGLEIVLGIDNLLFIAILADRLPEARRAAARKVGLALALVTRLLLLAALAWIVGLTQPIATLRGFELSWRDVILVGGGLFLLVKATREIHSEVEGEEDEKGPRTAATAFAAVVTQIAIIDIVFSLDSVITAVGMADDLWVMVVAVMTAVAVMLAASTPLAKFITAHPTVKMLALSFLILIGVVLIADGMHFHIPKGYVYFALFFSVMVEGLNQWARRRRRAARAGARA